jgi:hypothetical protein
MDRRAPIATLAVDYRHRAVISQLGHTGHLKILQQTTWYILPRAGLAEQQDHPGNNFLCDFHTAGIGHAIIRQSKSWAKV